MQFILVRQASYRSRDIGLAIADSALTKVMASREAWTTFDLEKLAPS